MTNHYISTDNQIQIMKEQDLSGYEEITPRFSYNRFSCLGGGNFGNVYEGWDSQCNRPIAVKHLKASTLKQKTRGLEQRQIDILKDLHHPNIMQFYGSHRSDKDGLFIFIEFCENGSLANYLDKNKLSEAQAKELFMQLADGMAYFNQKGYVHRDLKPDNLLLNSYNQLKIADLGTARNMQSNKQGSFTYRRCTPVYSAPQVYLQDFYSEISGKYTQTCDVFSAGYILYEMLTGEQLTKNISTISQLVAFLQNSRQRGGFTINHQALNASWVALLKKMLSFDLKERPTFRQVYQELKSIENCSQKVGFRKPVGEKQLKISAQILQNYKIYINDQMRQHNIHTSCLKILTTYQQETSQLIPRVYKLLALYFSLSRYCLLVNKTLQDLHNPDLIRVNGQTLQEQRDKIQSADKKQLLQFIESMASRANKAIQQVRTLMLKQIIPQLEDILNQPANNIEKQVVLEYDISSELSKFKEQQYENNIIYKANFQRCVNNLFKTRSQIQILSDSDLKIYLILLILTTKKEDGIFPPEKQIQNMKRSQLLSEIGQLKKFLI